MTPERLADLRGRVARGELGCGPVTAALVTELLEAYDALVKPAPEPCRHPDAVYAGGCSEGCCDYYRCPDCGKRWKVEYDG